MRFPFVQEKTKNGKSRVKVRCAGFSQLPVFNLNSDDAQGLTDDMSVIQVSIKIPPENIFLVNLVN